MKKRLLHLFMGFALTGMLTAAGFTGATINKATAPAVTTETVEYTIQENESCRNLDKCSTYGDVYWIKDLSYDVPHDFEEFFTAHSIGYDGDVLVINEKDGSWEEDDWATELAAGKHVYKFCTQKNGGKIRCAGHLISESELRYKNGVFYVWDVSSDGNTVSYETYAISTDGSKLVHKDYARMTYNPFDFYAYMNNSNDESQKRTMPCPRMVFDSMQNDFDQLPSIKWRTL